MAKKKQEVKYDLVLVEFTIGVLLEVPRDTDTDTVLRKGADIANDIIDTDINRKFTPEDATHIELNPRFLDKNH